MIKKFFAQLCLGLWVIRLPHGNVLPKRISKRGILKLQGTYGHYPCLTTRHFQHYTFGHFWLQDNSGPEDFGRFLSEVFGQVRPLDRLGPKTTPAPRQVQHSDEFGPKVHGLDTFATSQPLLLSFVIKQQFQVPETSPAWRHLWHRDHCFCSTFSHLNSLNL